MEDHLSDVEVRVLGALIEKEMTTPDYYPMSLNALTNACNQSSNRDPVVQYDEATVAGAVETLRRRSLVRAVQQSGSRVMKYRHLMNETLGLDARQAAVLDVLMLRGPQTLGEIRTRSERLLKLDGLAETERVLEELIGRTSRPLVVRLPRRPGQKEARYAHLLAGEVATDTSDVADDSGGTSTPGGPAADRIGALEEAVSELRQEIADLRAQLEGFRKQFE